MPYELVQHSRLAWVVMLSPRAVTTTRSRHFSMLLEEPRRARARPPALPSLVASLVELSVVERPGLRVLLKLPQVVLMLRLLRRLIAARGPRGHHQSTGAGPRGRRPAEPGRAAGDGRHPADRRVRDHGQPDRHWHAAATPAARPVGSTA